MIDDFVEDFNRNCLIWKYDIHNGKRIYWEDRSTLISGSGILLKGGS